MTTLRQVVRRRKNAFGVGDLIWVYFNGYLVATSVERIDNGQLVYTIDGQLYAGNSYIYERLTSDTTASIPYTEESSWW